MKRLLLLFVLAFPLLAGAQNIRIQQLKSTGEPAGRIVQTDGSGSFEFADLSASGAIDSMRISGNTLEVYAGGSLTPYTADLSPYLDNTDAQVFDVATLAGTVLQLSISGDGEATKTIDLASLQDGTGTDDQTASEVPITDTGGFYISENTEGALQEVGDSIAALRTDIGSGGSGTDVNAIHSNVAGEINALTSKSTISSSDAFIMEDSDASYVKKKVLLSDIIESTPYSSSASLLDILQPPLIRNVERNNIDVSSETRWQITAINTTAKTITFDRELPYEINPAYTTEKWGCYYNYAVLADIDSVDYANNTIYYTTMVGSLAVGEDVFFFNPFRSVQFLDKNPVTITNKLSATTYNTLNCVWKHSDGTYRAWVGDGGYRFYLAESNDKLNWTGVDGTLQTGGSGVWSKTWCSSSSYCNVGGQGVKIPNSNYYISTARCDDGSGQGTIGVFVYDEDGNIIHVSDNGLVNYTSPEIIYYGGEWLLFGMNKEGGSSPYFWFEEMVIGDLDQLTIKHTTKLDFTIAANYPTGSMLSGKTDKINPFVYNDVLYLFFGTEPASASDEIFSANREWNVAYKKSKFDSYTIYEQSPVICNPVEGETVWGSDLLWSTDHTGGQLNFIPENGRIYIFMTAGNGTDTYQSGVYYIDSNQLESNQYASVKYDNLDLSLTGVIANSTDVVDYSASGIINSSFATSDTLNITNLKLNKSLKIKLTLSNSAELTLPSYCHRQDGGTLVISGDGTYRVQFDCWNATAGSEDVIVVITQDQQ